MRCRPRSFCELYFPIGAFILDCVVNGSSYLIFVLLLPESRARLNLLGRLSDWCERCRGSRVVLYTSHGLIWVKLLETTSALSVSVRIQSLIVEVLSVKTLWHSSWRLAVFELQVSRFSDSDVMVDDQCETTPGTLCATCWGAPIVPVVLLCCAALQSTNQSFSRRERPTQPRLRPHSCQCQHLPILLTAVAWYIRPMQHDPLYHPNIFRMWILLFCDKFFLSSISSCVIMCDFAAANVMTSIPFQIIWTNSHLPLC